MPTMLVCTVGGSPQPVARSIAEKPIADKVIFVCSKQSRDLIHGPSAVAAPDSGGNQAPSILAALRTHGVHLPEAAFELVVLDDPEDVSGCVRRIREQVAPKVRDWVDRPGPGPFNLIVDFTGGTKAMSAAITYVARAWPCSYRYVGGDARSKAGLGVVLDDHERTIETINPHESNGYRVAEDALTLCRKYSFRAAAALIQGEKRSSNRGADITRSLQTLRQLIETFAYWDSFQHGKALAELTNADKGRNDLRQFLSLGSLHNVENAIPEWRQRLSALDDAAKSQTPTIELVEDLLANAVRRAAEERFDDATARLYRAIEALAQARLGQQYDIRTADVPPEKIPWDKLPLEVGARWKDKRSRGQIEKLMLGLQDSYHLLKALNDPLGAAFFQSALGTPKKSPLTARNASILAHGFQPIKADAYEALRDEVLKLAETVGITQSTLPCFPDLQPV